MRPIFSAPLLIVLLSIIVLSQDYGVDLETARIRAQEVLKLCRQSMGGEANLSLIKGLQASGNFRAVIRGREVRGDLKIELLMPDKFMRTANITLKSKEITRIEAVNGDEIWTDAKGSMPLLASSRSAKDVKDRGDASPPILGGDEESGDGEMEAMSPEDRAAMQRRLRAEFNQFLVAVLLAPAGISHFNYSYEREVKTREGKFDVLSVKGPDGFAIWLFFDQKIHRPWMLSYRAPAPRVPGNQQASEDETGEPKMINYQCYFSDYRQVGQIWLPHHITRAADDRVVEELKINRYKLNPEIKPSAFEKKR